DGGVEVDYVSKNGKYIFALQSTIGSQTGQTSKKSILTYKFKKNIYKLINNLSTSGEASDIKKCLKKLKKKYKTGKVKDITYTEAGTYSSSGSSNDQKIDPSQVPATVATFDAVTADFAVNMLKSVAAREGTDKNILISPDSIATALAMAENGANGQTLQEMLNVLSPGMTLDEYCSNLGNFNTRVSSDKYVTMHIADSIWIKNSNDIKIKDTFIQKNKTTFNADSYLEPFTPETVGKINDWVNTNTNQMIPTIIDSIPEDAFMYLINAIAFEGDWAKTFSDSQVASDQTFKNQDGTEGKVNMLNGKEYYYIELNNGVGFVKTYKGGNFAFVGILPPEGTTTVDYINGLKGKDFINAVLNKKTDKDVYIKLPEFKYDYSTSLKGDLGALGMPTAFTNSADFSNMIEYCKDPYQKIDDVIHKTHIEVDKNGTKAAAVTAVVMASATSLQNPRPTINIYLDRPFVYGIVDVNTGVPIFIGAVNKLG
ncbi:MAG: serpin family protein, partial [Lachnospiraceae bacterium]|nr:serpin family protein [Lachnospiraceae bacterium]